MLGLLREQYHRRFHRPRNGPVLTAVSVLTLGLGIAADSGLWLAFRVSAAAQTANPTAAPRVPSATDERQFIADLRQAALQYSAHLPNFICKQVTRRRFDRKGDGAWRDVDESSQLVSFYEGEEHYQHLTVRRLARDSDLFQPWMNSTGEFGSLLRQIFTPDAAARFSPVGTDRIRDHAVQTLSYEVDFKHSKYQVLWREAGMPMGVVDAYHGLLYVDSEGLSVLRLTLEVQPLPVPFPVRRVSLTLDYGDAIVAGQVYNLPLSFTMVVQMQKGERIRNEVSFRDFRRFTASSRVIPDGIK